MRVRTVAAAAATSVLGVGVAAVAAGRYASGAALNPARLRPLPGDPPLTVHTMTPDRITLTRSLASQRPGTYGLMGPGCHAIVGPVLDTVPHPVDCVVRRLERVTHGVLETGTRMWLTPQVHIGNPRDALGLDHADVDVPGDVGSLPAWFVPGARDTWVIAVHGLGTSREHPMVVMPFLHRHHISVLSLAYRGDLGAPRSPDGVRHLGDTEWRDVDAAIRYAVRYGARRVILHGWSTGATMVLRAAAESPLKQRITGLILDSPVFDWRTAVRTLAAADGVPRPLLPLAVRAAQGRTGLDERLARLAAPDGFSVPTLILHGPDDAIAPWETSRALAAARPELITLHSFPRAPHAAMWNADPHGYEEALRRFLTPLM
ncbi:alpha/beta hydrolase family protein [Streptomyces sp. URMC 123]|uniref:alpha/beta hydrolase family protein n=1 Tax=Streptomyces sp. URMC 123 TaxID=3423403 RepID=UPI003F1B1F2A